MLKALEGVYRNGKIELFEQPEDTSEARVVVTFMGGNKGVDLRARGISESDAASLRARLATMAENWNRPEMDVYDEA